MYVLMSPCTIVFSFKLLSFSLLSSLSIGHALLFNCFLHIIRGLSMSEEALSLVSISLFIFVAEFVYLLPFSFC